MSLLTDAGPEGLQSVWEMFSSGQDLRPSHLLVRAVLLRLSWH